MKKVFCSIGLAICFLVTQNVMHAKSIDMVEILPAFPDENLAVTLPELGAPVVDESWILEKNYTVFLESKLGVNIPLEIISDIEIESLVLDDEEVNVPFEIELNKTPKRQNYYKLKYSETELDIDNDGKKDTFIYSPKYINKKIITDNYVKIQGKNISKDGKYQKKVYITVEVDE
jgi:hypothetical protein